MPPFILQGDLLSIARLVRDRGPLSRVEIARRLQMSPSTVGRMVEDLIEWGLLSEENDSQPAAPVVASSWRLPRSAGAPPPPHQAAAPRAGRPSIKLRFNSDLRSVLTVDLRQTDAYAAITDLSGNRLLSRMRQLPTGPAGLEGLLALIQDLLSEAHGGSQALPPVEAIAIGAPSIVQRDSGVIEWAPALGWENLPLKDILEQRFTCPALVENDVNLAALGEYWKGAGRQVQQHMVFVSVGTGIGAGIIVNGELLRGASGAAGEVAYFITDVDVLRDNVGRVGSLESRVGSEGLMRKAHLVAQRYPGSRLARMLSNNDSGIGPGDVLALADNGDHAAQVIVKELLDSLTVVICNIAVLLDPELVVLGGPADWKWTNLIPAIQQRIGASLLRPVNMAPTQLGSDALILGGTYSALDLLTF
jgi:predicted NBD/HSP70 family sugar kinase